VAAPARGISPALIIAGLVVLNGAWIALVALRTPALQRQRGRVLRVLVPVTVTVLSLSMATALTAPRTPATVRSPNDAASTSARETVPMFAHTGALAQAAAPIPVSGSPPAGPPVWLRLIGIERDIARARQVLTGIDATAPKNDAGTHSGDMVASAHRLEAVALADERAFYLSVAGDTQASAQLVAAASASGDADAIAAVAVDLGIVRAEMARQSAITDAERALARVGSLGPTQLAAIASRAPFLAPVLGPVSQGFGPSTLEFEPPAFENGISYAHFHTGLDIAAPLYSPIHAAADGTVLFAGPSADGQGHLVGFGLYVVIAHPQGFVTLYGHLSGLSVYAGQTVRQGEIVGFEGSTGNSTGPHLHFEVRAAGDPIDPGPFVRAQLGR
jgi:murein DD-endopeptidase MepM/ murein hydrolase activator NlpD